MPSIVSQASSEKGLYAPFRALGYVTIDVPFNIQARGTEFFLTTCIDRSFQIYDVKKMGLLFVGPRTKEPITAIASSGDLTFAASGANLYVFNRAKQVALLQARPILSNHNDDDDSEDVDESGEDMDVDSPNNATVSSSSNSFIHARFTMSQLLILGELVFAVCDDNTIRIWNFVTKEFHNQLSFGPTFNVTTILHPSTYLNKILVASQEGKLQLWNFSTMRCIYEFPKSLSSPITCLVQSPVVDVVAIGTLNGVVSIRNIRADLELMSFQQESKITAISFRTDEHPHMATANMHGDVALWDMEKKRLFHTLKGAHDGLIMSMQFLNGQPLMITGGADNAVKQWLFDSVDGLPRILKFRSGHHAPPTTIRHYGPDGRDILSVGRDRSLRLFSVIRDAQNIELSQGPSLMKKAKQQGIQIDELKLPHVTQFHSSTAKARQWDNILTCHAHHNEAKTWSFERKAIGKHSLKSSDGSSVTSVSLSFCGNFGLIGSAKGAIDLYNMQSGLHRRSFGKDGPSHQQHSKAVTGLTTDNLSRVVYSCSLDGTVKVWCLIKSGKCLKTIDINAPISQMICHQESGLLALIADDLCVRVLDTDTYRVVREFHGHRNRILDVTFSFDARWIVSTSLDSTIRTWDLPSGNQVDVFKTDSIATSVSFSPSGDFLATAHVDQVGIFLWSNKSLFSSVILKPVVDDDVIEMRMPTVSGSMDTTVDGEEDEKKREEDDIITIQVPSTTDNDHEMISNDSSSHDIVEDMISLSSQPKSKWQTLLNIDAIKKRNKPKEAPKVPEKAPFFLPTVPGATPTFFDVKAATDSISAAAPVSSSKILKMNDMELVTEFTRILRSCAYENDFTDFFKYLTSLSPSAADFEIRSLSPMDNFADFKFFIAALKSQLMKNKDFELVQAYMNAFLKLHGDVIAENKDEEDLYSLLREYLQVHQERWGRLENLMQYGLCMLDFVRLSI